MKDFRLMHKFHWITSIFLTILLVTGHLILAQTITGPTCVQTGTVEPWQYGSNSIPPGNTRTWCVTGGIIRYPTGATNSGNTSCLTTSSVNVINVGWNNGITTGSVNLSASGYGSTTLTVNVPPAVQAGTVSPSTQTKDYNTTPTTISGTAASGGACTGGTYTYSWYKSTDNVAWTAIASANTQNYSPPALTTTTYFRRYVVTSFYMSGYSTTATVFVNPQFLPGTLTAPAGSITYNTSPGSITNMIATGGGCSGAYTYVWEKSLDSINFTVQAGANQINYDPGNLTVTSWFRRKATCGSQTAYTNKIKVTVAAVLAPGTIASTISIPIPYNTAPGQITGSLPTGGSSMSTYVYTWQLSSDSINFSDILGASSQHYSPSTMTSKLYFRRKVSCGTETKYSNTLSISVASPPLSSGTVTSPLNVSVVVGQIPDPISATAATGGYCSSAYSYRWQFSYDGSVFDDMENDTIAQFTFSESVDSTVYFRRKVVCGSDSLYTQQVAVTVIQPFNAGMITSSNQLVTPGTASVSISATPATEGSCGNSYQYQWQQSFNGLTFVDLPGMTGLSLSYSESVNQSVYLRRKSMCGNDFRYTNTIVVILKDTGSFAQNEVTSIDSLLQIASINIDSTFNIISDSIANDRAAADPLLVGIDSIADLAALTSIFPDYYLPLEANQIDSIINAPAKDSTQILLAISSEGGIGVDSLPLDYAPLSDSVVQDFRSQNNFLVLDSLTDINLIVSFEEASLALEFEAIAQIPDSLRTSNRLYDAQEMRPSAVINGASLIQRDSITHYNGNFVFPTADSSNVRWVVRGGQIISQNAAVENGPLFANVKWTSSFGIPYIGLLDVATKQFQTLPVLFSGLPCRIFPVLQNVFYGATPSVLSGTSCQTPPGTITTQYQWQILDVYSGGSWLDIMGATEKSYQPAALTSATWLMYRRISRYYNGSMVLLGTQLSTGVSVKLTSINAGLIKTTETKLKKNAIPHIFTVNSIGGLTQPGTTLEYTWEYSIDNSPWQTCGNGMNYPNYPITYTNTRIRRAAKVLGLPAGMYSLPSKYWLAYSNILNFTTFYETVDYENRNYIRENIVKVKAVQTWEQADMLPNGQKQQATQYLDGLSRPNQIVEKGFSYDEQTTQWRDLVQVTEYGAGGRIDNNLLPYPSTENSGKYKGQYKLQQTEYYANTFEDDHAFSKVEYDNSPMNKTTAIFGPGDSWVGAGIKTTSVFEKYLSSEGVRVFTIGAAGSLPLTTNVYPEDFLLKNMSTDEKGNKTIVYQNKAGQLVLSKVQIADAGSTLTAQHDGWLCTYHVYDDFGRLRYRITPKAVQLLQSNNWIMTQPISDGLCFWMEYDERARLIVEKSPGKEKVLFVYNNRSQQILMQDGNLSAETLKEWKVRLPDDFGRLVLEGIYKSNSTRESLQTIANGATSDAVFSTIYGGNVRIWGSPFTQNELNNAGEFLQIRFNYYDGYNPNGTKTFNGSIGQNLSYKNSNSTGNVDLFAKTSRTLGKLIGSKYRIIDDNPTASNFLSENIFFDEQERIIQRQEDNIKGGTETISLQYHFDGRLLSTSYIHNIPSTSFENFEVLTKYVYNNTSKLISRGKKINSSQRSYVGSSNNPGMEEDSEAGYKILASYKYNDLQRRITKILSPTYNQGQGLESIQYDYNLRGWLTGINRNYALGLTGQWDRFFGQVIGYDNKESLFDQSQYNGSVTGTLWKSQGDNVERKFNYVYDNAYRLKEANFLQKNDGSLSWTKDKMDFTTKNVLYDLNGNIQAMKSYGKLPGSIGSTIVDELTYTYKNYSNELIRVDDAALTGAINGKNEDFVDGSNASQTDDYSYDNNGNLSIDKNKNISAIEYNLIDKPSIITLASSSVSGGGTIKFVYDGVGNKLKKIVTHLPHTSNNNQTIITTNTYVGDFIYESVSTNGSTPVDELTLITHEEGRIRIIAPYVNTQDPSNIVDGGVAFPDQKQGVFDYYITDHLSNIRTTITEEINKSASVCSMEDASNDIKIYEEALFGNAGSSNEVLHTRFDRPYYWTSGTPQGVPVSENNKVSKLQALANIPEIGPNSLLKVMAGDKINAKVDYYYLQDAASVQSSNGITALLQGLGMTLLQNTLPSAVSASKTLIENGLNANVPLGDMFADGSALNNPNLNAPRAYLTYVFFDEQFNYVDQTSGFKRVSVPGNGAPALVVTNVRAVKNGYVYIYLSNESGEPVYFDNFSVSHEKSQLIADDHYYAFGSRIAAISSKALRGSLRIKTSGKGFQGLFSEEINDFDLFYNDFKLRSYDPQIGRWLGQDPYEEFASPYTGMGNNPASFTDPTGGWVFTAIPFIEHGAWLVGGSTIGTIIGGATNGWDRQSMANGAWIGGSVGLAASFVNWENVGKWLGNNFGSVFQLASSSYWILYEGQNVITYSGSYGNTSKSKEVKRYAGTSGLEGKQSPDNQNSSGDGPVPEGDYKINLEPDFLRKAKTDSHGDTKPNPDGGVELLPWENGNLYSGWGQWRARLQKVNVKSTRDNFYFHDSYKGYSHGCVETSTDLFYDLYKYKKGGRKSIKVKIDYEKGSSTRGATKQFPPPWWNGEKIDFIDYIPFPKPKIGSFPDKTKM